MLKHNKRWFSKTVVTLKPKRETSDEHRAAQDVRSSRNLKRRRKLRPPRLAGLCKSNTCSIKVANDTNESCGKWFFVQMYNVKQTQSEIHELKEKLSIQQQKNQLNELSNEREGI